MPPKESSQLTSAAVAHGEGLHEGSSRAEVVEHSGKKGQSSTIMHVLVEEYYFIDLGP